MTVMHTIRRKIHNFRHKENGAAIVEFALSLPLILVVSYGLIDSMRLFWSYQATIAGVRDASRYIARVAPADLCETGTNLSGFETRLRAIVDSTITGDGVTPTGINITDFSATVDCIDNLGLRQPDVPIATITAELSMDMPFSNILAVIGGSGWGSLTTEVREQARIYGL